MDFGVPLERHRTEHRVGLTPRGTRILVEQGHRVFVEAGAGDGSRLPDAAYIDAGAEIVFQREEVYLRSEVVLEVTAPSMEEIALTREGQAILAFWHLGVAPKALVAEMTSRKLTALGYEIIELRDGTRPVLHAMSELAGPMTIHTAAHLLQRESGGRGILLGAGPGIPPATVLILGAGTVGMGAAMAAVGNGAHVIVLDDDIEKLRLVRSETSGQVVTSIADRETIERLVQVADVVIGAVLRPAGTPAPFLVTREMVSNMRDGSVILDLSIDQGGCVETSRPTTIDHPTFVVDDVVHYCVPNMTANIPRTASKVLTLAHIEYLQRIGKVGFDEALRTRPKLARGVYMYHGTITKRAIAPLYGVEHRPIDSLLGEGRS